MTMSDTRPEWFDDPEFPWVQELLDGANISASDMFHVQFSRNHRTSSASLPAGNGRLTPSSPRLSGGGTRWPTLNFRGGPFDIHFDAGEWLDVLSGTTIARQYLTLEEQLAAFE